MKKFIPLLVLAFTSTGLVASEDLMEKLDTDKDEFISIEEAAEDASLAAIFTTLDTNKDGLLSAAELEKIEDSH